MANAVIGKASDILSAVKTWATSKFVAQTSGKGLSSNDFTSEEKTKLSGIASGAEVNVISTIQVNGVTQTPSGKTVNIQIDDSSKIPTTEKGVANGVASLGSDGKVPSSQLPSYVDDVLEYASLSAFPASGESGKIYIAIDSGKTYRWGGSSYAEISASIAIGTTTGTALDGKVGNDHINNTTVHITSAERTAWNGKGSYSKPSGGIPKSDLASDVQTSLGKADSALQSHQSLAGYVPTSRKVGSHALTSDVTLTVSDISDLEFMTLAEMQELLGG